MIKFHENSLSVLFSFSVKSPVIIIELFLMLYTVINARCFIGPLKKINYRKFAQSHS